MKVIESEVLRNESEDEQFNNIEKELRSMKLLITKILESLMEEKDTLMEALVSVIAVMRNWIQKGVITEVINKDNKEIDLEESDIMD